MANLGFNNNQFFKAGNMRHKTLFRLFCKALGIYFGVAGFIGVLGSVLGIITQFLVSYPAGASMKYYWPNAISQCLIEVVELTIGVYLFFDARYLVNLAIPGSRPYCPECGYDLTANPTGPCPECGVDPKRGQPNNPPQQ
jgi:hypothetical protein